jgi:hypothetical protein
MKRPGLSDKERKLVEAARREVAAKRGGGAPAQAAPTAAATAAAKRAAEAPAPMSPLDGRTVIGWDHPAASATPLDQPTVTGWDHPAAQGAGGSDAEARWSRIAALMETERAEAIEKRQRIKRRANIFLVVVAVLVLLVAARILLKR